MPHNYRINKCCFVKENQITVKPEWSYLCEMCGRYTYDNGEAQLSLKDSISTLGAEAYYKFFPHIKPAPAKQKVKKTPKMVHKKSWDEFRNTGLLFFINQILHVFGWAIVFDFETYNQKTGTGKIKAVYPARVKYRGFGPDQVSTGYRKMSQFMAKNASKLLKEAGE